MSLEGKMEAGSKKIRSGLPDREMTPDPFMVLEEVSSFDEHGLSAKAVVHGSWWEAAEAAAQACCLHQRWLTSYRDHVFLLSVEHALFSGKAPSGEIGIRAALSGQTRYTASYDLHITMQDICEHGREDCGVDIQLTVGHKAYSLELSRDRLSEHYKGYWKWLTEGRCDLQ